jgi:hypothetical protein
MFWYRQSPLAIYGVHTALAGQSLVGSMLATERRPRGADA